MTTVPSPKTILIIEDDPFLSKTCQMKLEKEGFIVASAMTGSDALAYLNQKPVDVVLLDLMLPGVSGFDILEAIRNNKDWSKVPVIVLTNLGQPQDIQHAKELGSQEYLVKANTRINEVVEVVRKFL
jgi:DNA-binding response OmpR family regulator